MQLFRLSLPFFIPIETPSSDKYSPKISCEIRTMPNDLFEPTIACATGYSAVIANAELFFTSIAQSAKVARGDK